MTTRDNQTVYLRGGNPDTLNESAEAHLGDLGRAWTDPNGVRRRKVRLDSGATVATPVGLVTAGELAYWKDRTEGQKLVTNDIRFAPNAAGHNSVAGVFTVAVTPSNYCCVSLKRPAYNVKAAGATWNVDDTAVSNDSSNAADIKRIASGTAPTTQLVGTVAGALAAGLVPINLMIDDGD